MINSKSLLSALKELKKLKTNKINNPAINGNVLLSIKDSNLNLFVSDIETGYNIEMYLTELDNDLIIPALNIPIALLEKIVSKFKDQVYLSYNDDNKSLFVGNRDNRRKYSILSKVVTNMDYKSLYDNYKSKSNKLTSTTNSYDLGMINLFYTNQKTFQYASQCTSDDASKNILTALSIKAYDNKITLCSTDGYRLAKEVFGSNVNNFDIILNSTVINLINKSKLIKDKDMQFYVSEKLTLIRTYCNNHTVSILGRNVEGRYPTYEKIIPSQFESNHVINKESLLSLLADSKMMISKESRAIRLSLNGMLEAQCNNELGSFKDSIHCDSNINVDAIQFNIDYLEQAIKTIDDKQVLLSLNSNVQPCIITDQYNNSNRTFLLMPIKL